MTFKSAFAGAKNFYVLVGDTGNLTAGWLAAGSWNTAGAPPAAPAITGVSPNAGSGTSQTFTVTLSDSNGHTDIVSAGFLIHTAITAFGGCYLSYERAANSIFLLRDADQAWLPLRLGSSASVENARCILSGAGLSVAGSGNTLTIRLPLTFKSTFAGTKNFYVLASDAGNLTAGWLAVGSWNTSTSPPAAPAISGVTPNAGSGTSQTFTVTLSDANGNTDIASAGFLIHSAITAFGGCYLSYERSANTIYLLRDADQAWLPLPLGSTASIENDNCALSAVGLTAIGSGNTLTVSLPLTFKPAFAGAKNFYVMVNDAGNLSAGWLNAGSWNTSNAPPAAPTISGTTPNSGSGTSQTFTVTLSDANGSADIASAGFLIHSAITAFGGCYLSYERSANTVYLLRDADQAWLPLPLGSNSSVQNANCVLSGAGLSVAGSGNTLTIKLPLTFKPAFAGAKNLYVLVSDSSNLTVGWLATGSWNVP